MMQNRNYIPLIFVIFALPLFASFVIYNFADAVNLNTKNFGTLLSTPVPISSLGLLNQEGKPFIQDVIHSRWVLIYLSNSNCSAQCLKDLSALENVRRALGKDYRRTELLLLEGSLRQIEYPGSFKQFPAAVIDDLHRSKLAAVSGTTDSNIGSLLFLADDQQNVIISYPGTIDQQSVYDDLRWLLKVNQKPF